MEPNSLRPDFTNTTDKLLAVLDARSRDVISRRYGLVGAEIETLESIGREYGITRERVRQIEYHAKRILQRQAELLDNVKSYFDDIFTVYGGILTHDHLTEIIKEDSQMTRFYLDILPQFVFVKRDKYLLPHWRHENALLEQAYAIAQGAVEHLKAERRPVTKDDLHTAVSTRLAQDYAELIVQHIEAALVAAGKTAKTPFAEWGLIGWPETTPSGVGDKAYAVLRRHGKPQHFSQIAELINEAKFDKKTANPQTVHNELIKDSRFVLVGRGLYGLKEWGFVPGTVADVLAAVLEKNGQPMTKDELVKEVLKQRMVKKNTILLGLQNSDRFRKNSDGTYRLA